VCAVPELPEVETIRRQLAPELPGRRVLEAWGFPSPKFAPAVHASRAELGEVSRRGKYLLITMHGAGRRELVIHLGMTGSLVLEQAPPRDAYTRAWWCLDDGRTLLLRDPRRFGRVAVIDAGDHHLLPTLARMGPEPLSAEFTPEGLRKALAASRVDVKTQLLNQRVVAGLGNIYADEALWRAHINPAVHRIGPERASALHAAIRAVLTEALENRGTTLRDYRQLGGDRGQNQFHLDVYGRGGQACNRCGTALRTRVLSGRTTTWCPSCQPR
jgi:formamidopyrimidine-DNA glycosylase